jgi:heme-degrading monooxygenase HmoA
MVLELVKLRVASGNEEHFLRDREMAIEAIRDAFPGLQSARLFRGEEPEIWFDIVFWDSMENAKKAAEGASSLFQAAAWFAHIQEVSLMEHGSLVHEFTATDD